jgi:hypothetical protein
VEEMCKGSAQQPPESSYTTPLDYPADIAADARTEGAVSGEQNSTMMSPPLPRCHSLETHAAKPDPWRTLVTAISSDTDQDASYWTPTTIAAGAER